jgi:transglutaminase-like putative cysteine protease
MNLWLPRLFILVLALTGPAHAEHIANVRLDRSDVVYAVNPDQTYSETVTVDRTLLTPRGIRSHDRSAITYYPDQQTLEVLEAWVDQPDGSRLQVGADGRFTRPSAASQGAPGFTGSLTTTIVYPQLRPGSRTHVKFRRVQTTPPLLGFNAWFQAELVDPTLQDRLEIDLPADLTLRWRSRGAVTVSDTTEGDRRRIVAAMAPTQGQEPERDTVDASDFQPIFLATTLPDLEAVGAIYDRRSQGRAVVTPEIAGLAAKIVGERTGLDAARAIYDWVTVNIRYIALTLSPDDGWVPHAAAEVLANGYGDCKDHTVLMQALLAARGIVGQAALIQWGSRYADLPLGHAFEFNHAIVYLPDYDLYLNPTNPYAPFGSLDRTLSGKRVVIATATGRVARTPASTPFSYRYAIDSRVAIDGDGTVAGEASWTMSANVDADIRTTLANASSPGDLMERLLLGTPEGGFGSFKASDPRDLATPLAVSATWRSPHGVTLRGGEAAITVPGGPDLEPAHRLRRYLSADGTRRTPMLVGAIELSWTTTISLPPGIVATRLPAEVDLRTGAGRYTARYRHAGAAVLVSRTLVIDHDVFQPGEYPELERLLYAALDDARGTLTLSREEAAAVGH